MAGLREDSLTSLITVFSIEHLLVLFVIVYRFCYERPPKWVRTFYERRKYKERRKAEKQGVFKKYI
jgi:hypothetical protein